MKSSGLSKKKRMLKQCRKAQELPNDNYTQRFFQGWEERKCSEDGQLRPFSQTELEHICMLNEHLKQFTVEVIRKAQRISRFFQSDLANGNRDFEDYDIEACISMAYGDDCDEELQKLIEETRLQSELLVIHLSAEVSMQAQESEIARIIELYNDAQTGIGRLWNEMWDVHKIPLSWVFGYFFNDLSIFTMEDIMKIQPGNFTTEVKVLL
jgi:hypothetical protein